MGMHCWYVLVFCKVLLFIYYDILVRMVMEVIE